MQKEDFKQTEEILAEIYRNTQLALQSIADIMPQVDDIHVKEELKSQHETYEQFSARASMLAKDKNIELKEPNQFKKMMMWGSIKMNTLTDGSTAHIADMMIQGTVMGISALLTSANDADREKGDKEVLALLDDLIKTEEELEKKWKAYL